MKKIEKLTDSQTAKLTEYRDKWIRIGLDTRPCNREQVEAMIPSIYEGKAKCPSEVIWANSPYEAIKLVTSKYEITKEEAFNAFCYGQHDANWLGFYEYFNEVLDLKEQTAPIMPMVNFAKNIGWFMPFEEVFVAVERPCEVHLVANGKAYHIVNQMPDEAIINGVLHCDGGMAVKYRDGEGLYRLNGVNVPMDIATVSGNKLDPTMMMKITNAEVRREFVRKVGMERIIEKCGAKCIDKRGEYELLTFDIGDGIHRPYLKMTNPSIGVYHVEGVPPNTKTVKEALAFRNGTDEEPEILT